MRPVVGWPDRPASESDSTDFNKCGDSAANWNHSRLNLIHLPDEPAGVVANHVVRCVSVLPVRSATG
jgi:hypothetical protein